MSPMPVACSPPASALGRSPAVPVAARRGGAPVAARVSDGGAAGSLSERRAPAAPGSVGGSSFSAVPSRFSFTAGGGGGSAASAAASRSASISGGARPPRPGSGTGGPFASAASVLVGFDAPLAPPASPAPVPCGAPPAGALSPSRPGLLSMALSDMPAARSLSFGNSLELAGLLLQDPLPPCEPDMAPLDALAAQHPALAAPLVRAAYAAAARAHAGQRRKSGEPVLAHCLATAGILAELGLPEETLAAGLLHDALCDTQLTAVELEEYVPRSCVELVEKVSRLSELSQLYRDNAHSLEAAAMLDMLTSMSDVSALLIKLADRLHNMRTVSALPRSKQVRMASETLDVFAVLANRLGAWSVKAELEDLAFQTLHPEEYEQVAAAVAARTAAIDLPARVEQARAALDAAGLEVVDVSGRVKNVYGVWRKLHAAGLGPEGVDEVYDVAALRVVVPHKHDCYRALRAVEAAWAPLPGRFKDYIRNRKGNGYQSLHTSVAAGGGGAEAGGAGGDGGAPGSVLEVQIRTPKMHYIAEYGFAAHWRYKEQLPREDLFLDRLVQWRRWIAASKLGLADGKVRAGGGSGGSGGCGSPAGSPAPDPALAPLLARGGAAGDGAGPAESPGASPPGGAGPDARFLERFTIAPVSDADLAARGAPVMVSGPRGARVVGAPPGASLASLLAELPEAAARHRAAVEVNGRPVPLLAARDVILRPGDLVAFVQEPAPAPAPRRGGRAPAAAPAGADPALSVFALGGGGGSGVPLEVALRSGIASSSSQLRQAALAL